MAINKAALTAPSGILKIVALVLTVIVLIIARTGFPNSGIASFRDTDHSWMMIIATGGYTIILANMILTYLTGDAMPAKTEFVFMVLGAILFFASGALAIEVHHNIAISTISSNARRDTGLAMGSIAIIDGIVMLVDAAILAKVSFKK